MIKKNVLVFKKKMDKLRKFQYIMYKYHINY
jgi:hypothetical protein